MVAVEMPGNLPSASESARGQAHSKNWRTLHGPLAGVGDGRFFEVEWNFLLQAKDFWDGGLL
jgi:hypothetical protein